MESILIAITGLGGVVLGAVLGPMGTHWLESRAAARRRRAVASALAAEIGAMLEVSARRKYDEVYAGWLAAWKAGDTKLPSVSGLETAVEKGDPIFLAHLSALGDLPQDLAGRVVTFYAGAAGLRLDLVGISRGDFSVAECVGLIEEDLAYWQELKPLGESLVVELRAVT